MPYTIEQDGPDDKPYCIYRVDADGAPTGDTLGCHPTEAEAQDQIGAIESNEGDKAKTVKVIVHKTFDFELLEHREDGGRIRITTPDADRIGDRVLPDGALIENYLNNPIVQYGHNYGEPWATIGRTDHLESTKDGILADFTLRPAANDADPQSIVRLLWAGKWLRSASIGFMPRAAVANDLGGQDYSEWELLEWSLVPVPMNPQALSMALKAFDGLVQREGRVLSTKNREMISNCVTQMQEAVVALKGLLDATEPPEKSADVGTVTIKADTTQTVTPTPIPVFSDAVLCELTALARSLKSELER